MFELTVWAVYDRHFFKTKWFFLLKEKSREELETEILTRFSDSVKQGLEVLDDAFITVEIKAEIGIFTFFFFFGPLVDFKKVL